MKKAIIMRKNADFFYGTLAIFIKDLHFFNFLNENLSSTELQKTEFEENGNQVFLEISHKINKKNFRKIIATDRKRLIIKMQSSVTGEYDEKCQFDFNDISYAFKIKGYQLAPGFVLKPEEIEKIQKFVGDESIQIIAELKISPVES